MKLSWKDVERAIKKARGKDVPNMSQEIPEDVQAIFEAGEQFILKGALVLIDEIAGRVSSKDGLLDVPLNIFNACVDALKKEIKEMM